MIAERVKYYIKDTIRIQAEKPDKFLHIWLDNLNVAHWYIWLVQLNYQFWETFVFLSQEVELLLLIVLLSDCLASSRLVNTGIY